MFQANSADLEYLFESAGQKILVNDVERISVITNPALSEFDQKYIHTLEQVLQGDMVTLEGERYLVITESISKRGGKYKALMRHCNVVVEIKNYTKQLIGHTDFGEPVYEDVYVDSTYIPSIIDNKSFSIDSSSAIRVPENQIVVVIQDNSYNREKFMVNDTFSFEGNYKVLNRDFTKKGLLILTCEKSV
ncbi:hypothetical protein [Bacillus sp. REN3]|uniref:hypothetical protein n=1 Tax=Bacillus sp. REN3 TaxID=2802440 RepID=UPI001AEDCAA9|nr:hypothetical protein [Bacillus sp. REN3]